jgi:hypothetical protein
LPLSPGAQSSVGGAGKPVSPPSRCAVAGCDAEADAVDARQTGGEGSKRGFVSGLCYRVQHMPDLFVETSSSSTYDDLAPSRSFAVMACCLAMTCMGSSRETGASITVSRWRLVILAAADGALAAHRAVTPIRSESASVEYRLMCWLCSTRAIRPLGRGKSSTVERTVRPSKKNRGWRRTPKQPPR